MSDEYVKRKGESPKEYKARLAKLATERSDRDMDVRHEVELLTLPRRLAAFSGELLGAWGRIGDALAERARILRLLRQIHRIMYEDGMAPGERCATVRRLMEDAFHKSQLEKDPETLSIALQKTWRNRHG